MSMFRVLFRLFFIAIVLVFCAPVVALVTYFFPDKKFSLVLRQMLYKITITKCFGIFVQQKGKSLISFSCEEQRPIVFMSNHISFTDIMVLGSLYPYTFVSKEEVASWPFIGWMTRMYGTLFISRESQNVKEGVNMLWRWLEHHTGVVLFPEGTTADGCRVGPFKSSYFSLPEGTYVQPVSIMYNEVNDLPATRFFQKIFCWRGEPSLLSHLWSILQFRRIVATVVFHPAFEATPFRKITAEKTWQCVQKGCQEAMECI